MQLCFMSFFFNLCLKSFLTLGVLAHMWVVLDELFLLLLPFLGMLLLHMLVKLSWSRTSPPVVFIYETQEAFVPEFVCVESHDVPLEVALRSCGVGTVVPFTFEP